MTIIGNNTAKINFVEIRDFFRSQVENKNSPSKFNQTIESLIKEFRKQYAHSYSIEDKKILSEVYKDLKILSRTSRDEALKELKLDVKLILKKVEFIDTFSIAKTGLLEKIKRWVSNIFFKIAVISRSINKEIFFLHSRKIETLKNEKKLIELVKKLEAGDQKKQTLKKQLLIAEQQGKPVEAIKRAITDLLVDMNNTRFDMYDLLHTKRDVEKELIEFRKNFLTIGGKRVSITTEDDVKIDGLFLSANAFRNKLIEMSAEVFTIDQKDFPKIKGLAFNKNKPSDEKQCKIFQALNQFQFFPKTIVEVNDKVLIIEKKDVYHFAKNKDIAEFEQLIQKDALKIEPLPRMNVDNIEDPNQGTIILASGALGHYEGQYSEALAFLMLGLNVMMFNYRGIGESEGEPSPEGAHRDAEAVYQYLKQVQHIKDEQIIGKGLSLGGGIVANLAIQHPKMHLFLDQSYSKFSQLINKIANAIFDKFLKREQTPVKSALMELVNGENKTSEPQSFLFRLFNAVIVPAIQHFSPKYSTLEGLAKVEGKVLILESRRDQVTPREHVEEMCAQLAKHNKLQNTMVGSIPGGHSARWYLATEEITNERSESSFHLTGQSLVDHYLKSLHMLRPIVPNN